MMEYQNCWGMQIGPIQAAAAPGDEGSPEGFSADHQDRVADFMNRHGGPAPAAGRSGRMDAGYRGWSELYAADGYVLRTEWSRYELRGTMNVSEIPPSNP
jgi:hypothetical protein